MSEEKVVEYSFEEGGQQFVNYAVEKLYKFRETFPAGSHYALVSQCIRILKDALVEFRDNDANRVGASVGRNASQ